MYKDGYSFNLISTEATYRPLKSFTAGQLLSHVTGELPGTPYSGKPVTELRGMASWQRSLVYRHIQSGTSAYKADTSWTSLNWSQNGSKNYTVDSLSRNRCQRPLTNCHIAETAGKWWRKDDPWPRDFPDIYLSIKRFQDVTNVFLKRLAPLWIHYIWSCENYNVAMPSSSDLGATKTASTKTKSNSTSHIQKNAAVPIQIPGTKGRTIWYLQGVEENMEINKMFPILLKINKLFPSLLEINKLFLKLPEKNGLFHPKNNLFAGLIP